MKKALPVVWSAQVKSGKLTIAYQEDFIRYIAAMKDCDVELIIRRKKKEAPGPTNKQRKYYWPVIVNMWAAFWQCDWDEAHETLLHDFATARREPGSPIRILRTSEMESPSDVEIYFAWCRTRASQCGFRIPLPNQVLGDDSEVFDAENYPDADEKKIDGI